MRIVGPPRSVVHPTRASSRDEGGVGTSGDDASPNAQATVAGTAVGRGSNAALSDGDDDADGDEDERGVADDCVRLAPFDVDAATSAWVLCRFGFIWVAFGYVPVPAYALLVETPVMDLPPKTQAACLLAAETGKLFALNAMLDAELGPTQTPRRRCFRSFAKNENERFLPFATLFNRHDVALGVACGALASVAARAADLVFASAPPDPNVSSSVSAESASSALDLFASIRGDPVALAAGATAAALFAPAAEELFFRGFLLPAVSRRARNDVVAVAVVAAAFAAAHFSVSDFPALFVAGAGFGSASLGSRARGGLVAPFLAHATFNALVLAEVLWRR